jgi:hypothetical protein
VIGPGLTPEVVEEVLNPVLPRLLCWVWTPFLTPPPNELAPKPILYSQRNQATITSEKPANIMARTLTAHFFGTIDA